MIASVFYAAYTYWPGAFPFIKQPQQQKTAPAAHLVMQTPAPEKTVAGTTEAAPKPTLPPPPSPEAEKEKELVDPFALRIKVKGVGEAAPAKPVSTEPKEAVPLPKLEGIWWDADMKVAFISGQAIPVGGSIMGWKVVAINKDRVVIRKGSSEKTLKMEEK
ncbi:hypothetical protein A3K48_04345 [candidate division WOR-1 bacterium RIFOXYA12_FULL_52_29]|uniref:Uncharacterized protein n=1 Tax=candidate division WOR-1 bacterium RIFOXYC12_FULL_54_18 TaxID=1802584 RepID=A0A1F4T660_UNCSA|nr:MAG: hypothetical protein A3K44_04345 [candidate division WOR-1 bacterium RIFOXYA2_FULL_51_19]OGC17781.1 MAG: hypothetical protein A3K48_04345 [candidate division WOR-1 bacterium RIFOXYA12_FULL_52_29]OGC26638.1 MAG: hypothetical protein A3K32_04340 [candidate division WOR-1 bacterium RIFOXYB2_FULL_45_9]OGC28198.1 MAG: hypothetical protein A3K49_04345 [candidate division WOR-1 bacterium RIFOXYC12_FULL_54_18]OGC29514.1 MAG: hypothetical protein A2346_01990 [candidate division WOR-1 bacterium R